ncbi:hypothetical protein D9619_006912 [Psilocybe cf. subviscida]|uniref:C2H2-type domain-containing protein n=1 Tax=Psilocybe cf. subviscida TaxID=2480587 RepID=A0A8H5B4G2_9AGAR|nr:hypothetical protein D9619_006912 [Psilocybe cf. subviscida]
MSGGDHTDCGVALTVLKDTPDQAVNILSEIWRSHDDPEILNASAKTANSLGGTGLISKSSVVNDGIKASSKHISETNDTNLIPMKTLSKRCLTSIAPLLPSMHLFGVAHPRVKCPACLKVFNTIAGRNSHTAQVKSCNEFLKTQLHELVDNLEQEHDAMDIDDEEDSHDGSHLQEPSPWIPMDHHEDELILLPEPDDQSPVPPSGSSTNQQTQGNLRPITLDDNEDTRHIVEHPTAGRIFSHHANPLGTDIASDNVYTPFSSELDWKVAEWAVKDRVGNNSFDRLLDIPGVVEKLGLSYKNIQNLHGVVDSFSERAGDWKTQTLSFDDRPDETFTIRYRCPVEAIKSLWADPNNQEHLVFAPKKVYSDETKENRIYNEMWTGQWWHVLQSRIPQGGTVAPVILATDKTQLTQFSGNKSAYPVYLTIGNLPKAIRRKPSKNACILIGYLSVQKFDRSSMTELEHRSRMQRAFHQSMKIILEPLIKAGKEGVQMRSSNGDVRLVFPILSCYVADYPEQCLVACSKYGTCPKCRQTANHLADLDSTIPPRTNQWTKSIIQDAQKNASGSMNSFSKACMEHDVAGGVYEPFWKDFPHSDIHKAITPDILHQIYQGLFKHVVEWCQMAVGTKELDRRIRTLPLGYGLRRFKNGISGLSQISGSERKNMAKILLACVHNLMTAKGIKAIRALIDFIFLAQYETHDNDTLGYLQDALNSFHENKSYFIEVDARKHLNLPKLHSISHYIQCIKLFGTTDNYNTEMFERLHIDFAKQGWRASNQRDEFPQMIRWLSRQEKITAFKLLQYFTLSHMDPLDSTDSTGLQWSPVESSGL